MRQPPNQERLTREIEDTDGYFVNQTVTDVSTPNNLTADDLLATGFEAVTELELLCIPEATIEALQQRVDDFSDTDIGLINEAYQRAKFYSLFDYEGKFPMYRRLAMDARDELWERYDHYAIMPIPAYRHIDGVPSSVGTVTTRLLPDWGVKMQVIEPDAGRNPTMRTVTAEVESDFLFSGDPVGCTGQFHDEQAWKLTGIGDDDGHTFALAPVATGEDTTLWVEDSFTDDFDDRYAVVGLTTYPSKYALNADQ